MKEYLKFYINGEWVDPVEPRTLEVENPATEESYEGRKVVVRRIARFDRRFTVVLARSTYLRPSRRGDQLRNFCLSCFENGPQTAMPEQAVEYGRKAT